MNRLKDTGAIEARLLELAHTTDAKITAPALAYFAPCSIDDANRVLDDLAARDRLRLEVEDDGTVFYEMPGRQKLGAAASPTSPPREARAERRRDDDAYAPIRLERSLVPVATYERAASPLLAAALTVMFPGAGHLYAGRVIAAMLWFLVVGMGYVLILPGLVLHLFAIVSAAAAANRLNAPPPRWQLAPISSPR